MSQYQIYLVKDGAVTTLVSNCGPHDVSCVREWIGKTNRMVYAHGLGKTPVANDYWYILTKQSTWKHLEKGQPKVIAMAELIDAVKPTTMKEIRNDLPVDTFFD